MKAVGDVLDLFRSHWQERSLGCAVRKALDARLPALSGSMPPINVEAAARYLGVSQILLDNMGQHDGLLSVTPSGEYVVTLNSSQPITRRRFTLAHEIGHIIVHESVPNQGPSRDFSMLTCQAASKDRRDEEKLCDRIAAELLMPNEQFCHTMEKVGACAESLPAIAREFFVSLQAASKRAIQALPYQLAVSLWTINSVGSLLMPKWYLVRDGLASLPYAIEVGKPGSECFGNSKFRGWRWIPLFGHMERYFVDTCPVGGAGRSWLAVFVFDNAAQQIMAKIARPHYMPRTQLSIIGE